jgi:3-oxoacyl-[acyl-carrier-protein] synthase-3
MRRAVVRSTSAFVPEREITNAALRARFESSAPGAIDHLEAVSGIRTRWRAPDEWATSDLALPAARAALERASVAPSDVDLVIVATDTPDYVTPATSVVLQHKLGATNAGSFDVGCACASFPTALAAAAGLIATNASLRNVLVVGAYMMQRLADPNDVMSFFYGDGSGAVLLQASTAPGVVGVAMRADGAYADRWCIASGGTREPATEDSVRSGRTRVRMREKYPDAINEDGWPLLVRKLARENAFDVRDVALFVFTQVRRTTIEVVMTRLELPMDRTHLVMHKWGYTGAACVPMALHDAIVAGRVKAGDLVVLVASGVGFNQAAVALRVTDALV